MILVVNALEGLLGLHREADGDLGRPIENLKHVIAQQAAEFAGGSRAAREFDAAIAGIAVGADDVGFFMGRTCACASSALHSARL
jgi:hypothetical protein